MKVLIVVDAQYDFIDEALENPAAKACLPAMADYIRNFIGDIYFTQDTHGEDYLSTQEGIKLPVKHCIKGTDGYAVHNDVIIPALNRPAAAGTVHFIEKPTFGYNGWAAENFDEKYDQVFVAGFCTDICVVSNVLILKAVYPELNITVLKDFCAGLTPEKHEAALEVMRSCQVEVI